MFFCWFVENTYFFLPFVFVLFHSSKFMICIFTWVCAVGGFHHQGTKRTGYLQTSPSCLWIGSVGVSQLNGWFFHGWLVGSGTGTVGNQGFGALKKNRCLGRLNSFGEIFPSKRRKETQQTKNYRYRIQQYLAEGLFGGTLVWGVLDISKQIKLAIETNAFHKRLKCWGTCLHTYVYITC